MEDQTVGGQATEDQTAGGQTTEDQMAGGQTTEDQTVESQMAGGQTTEDQTVEGQMAEGWVLVGCVQPVEVPTRWNRGRASSVVKSRRDDPPGDIFLRHLYEQL